MGRLVGEDVGNVVGSFVGDVVGFSVGKDGDAVGNGNMSASVWKITRSRPSAFSLLWTPQRNPYRINSVPLPISAE